MKTVLLILAAATVAAGLFVAAPRRMADDPAPFCPPICPKNP